MMSAPPDVALSSVEPPLRDAVLSGRHSRLDAGQLAPRLGRFLGEDRAALPDWFGWRALPAAADGHSLLRGMIDRDIAAIDDLIADQLDAILHDPALQRLEGSWRGLSWLAHGVEPRSRVKVKVLSASWRDLDRDAARAIEFDQSNLFRLVYENEFGTAGGEPFGLLVVDHEVSHRPGPRGPSGLAPVDDVSMMAVIASVAAAAFVPTVLAASPALLGADQFENLALSADVASVLDDDDHLRWRAVLGRDDMRFLCVALPRVLARPPWTGASCQEGGLRYEEYAPCSRERTWSVAGYAFAASVARAHADHGWPADIRGVPSGRTGGGLVLNLPQEPFVFGATTTSLRGTLSLGLTDAQERALTLAGFMPLNTLPHGEAAFASVHSLQATRVQTPGREPTAAEANRRISAQISAMLCASRFAHYIKVLGREMVGSLNAASDVQSRLQDWLMEYVNGNRSSSAEARARTPLLSARVQVHEAEGRPGSFNCVIHLQPHHQLDDMSAVFRLVTNFVRPGTDRV